MKPPAKFKYAIIDLDIPVFRAAAIGNKTHYRILDSSGQVVADKPTQKECRNYMEEMEMFMGIDTSEWALDPYEEVQDVSVCYMVLDNLIKGFIKSCNAEQGVFSIGGQGNFRDDIASVRTYKGNRTQEKPLHFAAVKDYAIKKYEPRIVHGKESDDQISEWLYKDYLACKDGPSNGRRIMCSLEKDCLTTPGWHYIEKEDRIHWQSEFEANKWVLTQSLIGDPCDGYLGCKGVGPKRVEKLFEGVADTPSLVKIAANTFKEVYGDEHEYIDKNDVVTKASYKDLFVENLSLALMLRTGDQEADLQSLLKYLEEHDND